MDIKDAWVLLFDDKNYGDRNIRIKYREDVPDMHKKDFNDKASSAQWEIPPGWSFVLYSDTNYKDRHYYLRGTGQKEEDGALPSCSSGRWETG